MALSDTLKQALAEMRAEGETLPNVIAELARRDDAHRLTQAQATVAVLAPAWTDAQWQEVRDMFRRSDHQSMREDNALRVMAHAVRTDDRQAAQVGLMMVALAMLARLPHVAAEFSGRTEGGTP